MTSSPVSSSHRSKRLGRRLGSSGLAGHVDLASRHSSMGYEAPSVDSSTQQE